MAMTLGCLPYHYEVSIAFAPTDWTEDQRWLISYMHWRCRRLIITCDALILIVSQRQYCPPIDPALFQALVFDYDVSQEADVEALRTVLESLKLSAQDEASMVFDPSGTSGLSEGQWSQSASDKELSMALHSGQSTLGTETDSTSMTELSHSLEGLDLSSSFASANAMSEHAANWSDLTEDRKSEILKEMFPSIKPIDVRYAVKTAGDNYSQAVEDLLNKVFLYDDVNDRGEHTFKRGIEGFTEPTGRSRRKKKGKMRIQRRTSSTPAYGEEGGAHDSPTPSSRWDRAKEDIEFIAVRSHISRSVISSMYHKHGASLPATIAALCQDVDFENETTSGGAPALVQAHASELAADFPRLGPLQTRALVTITFPSTAAAHELARVLATSSAHSTLADESIIPAYRPRSPSPPSPIALASPSITRSSPHITNRLIADRTQAHRQAVAAYRTSKSKPLMGGAAAYYSSVARDTTSQLRQREAAEANSLVSTQSRPGQVDLHGVTVQDGVRIAREEVDHWWDSEGREWARAGKAMNSRLTVVTGKGHHSSGGRGKLGPAVGAMLVREGWKVEFGDGTIDVVGKMRR